MFDFERDFKTIFAWIGNEKKQERFNALVREKNLSIGDLELILQTIKPKTSGTNSEIWRVKSVETAQAIAVTVNRETVQLKILCYKLANGGRKMAYLSAKHYEVHLSDYSMLC